MRLSKPLSLAVTAAAALISVSAAPVGAQALSGSGPVRHAGRAEPDRPTCAASGKRDFPVRTRIHGGPDAYDAGGGYRTWYIDLTNTTDAVCERIHPVVVLVDEKRLLKPEQPRLEFYDGERPRPVTFERTDEDEHIGVLDGFPGFTVAPGKTLSVKVRLAVTSDAPANDVVANAAVVQRHEDDGAWVGQSNDYRFHIVGADGTGDEDEASGRGEAENRRKAEGEAEAEGEQEEERSRGEREAEKKKETEEGGAERRGTGEPRGDAGDRDRTGAPDGVPDASPSAEEMAGTGSSSSRGVLVAAVGSLLLLGTGATVLIVARRRR
ncbi:hypothetical protein ACLVWQ_24245 [Streptomyces sp. CWNU-52B]|uniref:hypothetical protein n=1 Tax=unclassified Streptomyces TaxID=2593676 RepID=UPI0039C00FAE